MKSLAQKIAAILLAIALCIPLLSLTVSAADPVPFTGTMALTVDPSFFPVAGQSSYRDDLSVITGLPAGAKIDAGNTNWLVGNHSFGRVTDVTDAVPFQANTTYEMQLCIEFGTSGYTSEGLTKEQVTLNGTAATKISVFASNWFYAYFDMPTTAASAELAFLDNDAFDIPSDNGGTAISTVDVSKSVAGGSAPYTYTLESAPAWLSINGSGVISGTRPNVASDATTATVRVTDAASAYKTIEIAVGAVIATTAIESFNIVNDDFVAPQTGATTRVPNSFELDGLPFTLNYGYSTWVTDTDLPDGSRLDWIDGYGKQVFEDGVVYYLRLELAAKSGYLFDENNLANYQFNGTSAVDIDITNGGTNADVYFQMPATKTYFTDASINLGSDITVNYFVNDYSFEAPEMKFTIGEYTKTVDGVKNGTEWKFSFDGVAPQWMGENIQAELIVGGDVIAVKNDYSVAAYLKTLKAKTEAELSYTAAQKAAMDTLIDDLLCYGGAAQFYKNFNTGNYVSSGIMGTEFVTLTETDKTKTDNGTFVTFTNANVFFNNANKLMFKFTSEDMTGVTLKVKVNDGAESEIAYTADGEYYVVTTDAIMATGFDDVYTVTAYKGATKGASVTYSVKSYVYAMQDNGDPYMRSLAKMTYNYGLAAKAFVAALEA